MTKTALTMLAVASTLVLGGMVRADAATLDFDFSFSNSVGTVTGEIEGLTASAVGPASAVIIDSFPAALGPICTTPCNTMASPWKVGLNDFAVPFGGQEISVATFSSVNSSNGAELSLFSPNGTGMLLLSTNSVDGPVTFSLVPSETPLPAPLPLFATGLGALGLLGWRRKRKARVSLLGAG